MLKWKYLFEAKVEYYFVNKVRCNDENKVEILLEVASR